MNSKTKTAHTPTRSCADCARLYGSVGFGALCPLHAAAPDYDRIMRFLAKWIEAGSPSINFSALMFDGDETLAQAVTAAIAKAEGREGK